MQTLCSSSDRPTAPTPTASSKVSRNLGTIGYLIDNSQAIDPKWLTGVTNVAVTAGASAPEILVEDVVSYLRQNGYEDVEEVEVMPENVRFGLPPEIVQAIGSGGRRRACPGSLKIVR
ncbi:MAG: hypothetical protein WDM87_13830 [Terracidiphilus sp.]